MQIKDVDTMTVTSDAANTAELRGAPRLPSLSVVISCYNYGRFLSAAIDSVLAEDVGAQIIVVDDCSTDNTREVMQGYGDKIVPIFQPKNSGHGAAFNAGWEKVTGELVYFLDADDFVLPGALRRALKNHRPGTYLYHFRMRYSDETGALAGFHPAMQIPLGVGDISRQLREQGRYFTNVTSGLMFSREALDKVMPMDAESYRMCAEGFLVSVVPMYGPCETDHEPLSAYRLHGAQNWKVQSDFAGRARKGLAHDFCRYAAIREHAAKLGLPVADNLGDADMEHLNDRLISLSFDPGNHPVPGDSIARVVRLAKAVKLEGVSARGMQAKRLWWTLIGIVPGPVRRQILRWKMDPKSRPAWLASLGRLLRRRFGIVLR